MDVTTLVIGDIGSGKTSLIKRLLYNSFDSYVKPTVGVDFGNKTCDNGINFRFWELSSGSGFLEIRKHFYIDSNIVILCYDCTNINSFNNLERWVFELKKYNMCVIIAATKIDNIDSNASLNKIEKFAELNNMCFIQLSSKINQGIENLYELLYICHTKTNKLTNNLILPFKNKVKKNYRSTCNCYSITFSL